jgi:hypothetical protein
VSIAANNEHGKANTTQHGKTDTAQIVQQLDDFVTRSVGQAAGLHEFERGLLDKLLEIGGQLTDQFLSQLEDGDLGETFERDDATVYRSSEPQVRRLRTVFGKHTFQAYVYRLRPDEKSAIVLRPIDDVLGVGPEQYSPLLQEFSMMFCVEQAFRPAAEAFEAIFRQPLSVDTLERISRTMGAVANEFMDSLTAPPAEEEGELLVMTADGKGVPMVREDAAKLRACDPKPDRPGNRRSATVAAVYSIDRHVRTPGQILAALFSSVESQGMDSAPRPQPCHKRYTARFAQVLPDLDEPATGTQLAMAWTGRQIDQRRRPSQKLIRIMDGQHSLWDCAAFSVGGVEDSDVVEILDLLHVCSYIWKSAKALHENRRDQEEFAKDKLTAILEGRVASVIRSLRYLSTRRGLRGKKRKDVATTCGYFESHRERMKYDEYLAAGYPIATGVIEGACRHIVKDRMERSGMKWTLEGAQCLLNLRCLRASGMWNQFQQTRSKPKLHLNA